MDTAKKKLYDAVKALLAARSSGCQSPPFRKASTLAQAAITKSDKPRSPRETRAYDAAKVQWESEGEIEIDDDAVVSTSKEGAYVQAWVWVDK